MQKILIDLILDRVCHFCGSKNLSSPIRGLCLECYNSFEREEIRACTVCGHPVGLDGVCLSCTKHDCIHFTSLSFIQYYSGYFRSMLVRTKKEKNYYGMRIFVRYLIGKGLLSQNIPVTVIPDHPFSGWRKGRAGMNGVLAYLRKEGYSTIKSPIRKKLTLKGAQKMKSLNERISTVKEHFYLPDYKRDKYSGPVQLLDDVFTSGATMNYASSLLKAAGFNEVKCVTFFRAVLSDDYKK